MRHVHGLSRKLCDCIYVAHLIEWRNELPKEKLARLLKLTQEMEVVSAVLADEVDEVAELEQKVFRTNDKEAWQALREAYDRDSAEEDAQRAWLQSNYPNGGY